MLRLKHCSASQMQSLLQDLVTEYTISKDEDEAAHCWRDLDVAFYGHQLIYTILLAAFEGCSQSEQLIKLIERFASTGEVSEVSPL